MTPAALPPSLSVIVPVHNGAETIEACLGALERALPDGAELIVVDDGSTDDTVTRIEGFDFTLVQRPVRGGTSAARNSGWRASRGEIVAFVDADMVLAPDALHRMMATLSDNPGLLGVNGFVDPEPGAPGLATAFANTSIHYQHRSHGARVSSAYTAICALRRGVLEGMGGWDERWFSRYADDVVTRFHLPPEGLAADPDIRGVHLKRTDAWGLAKHRFNVGYFFVLSTLAHCGPGGVPPRRALLSTRYPLSTLGAGMGLAGLGLGLLGLPLAAGGGSVFLAANLPFVGHTLRVRGPIEAAAALPLCAAEATSYLAGMGWGALNAGRAPGAGRGLAQAAFAARYLRTGLSRRHTGPSPLFLTLFVTQRCPFACRHCLCGPAERRTPAEKELSLAELRQLAARLPPTPKLLITGGEPFVREDLPAIAAAFHDGASRTRQLTIPTTGWYTDRVLSLVDELLPARPGLQLELQLSIDGVGEDHDAIRGPGSFERLMSTWHALQAATTRHPGLIPRFVFTFGHATQHAFDRCFDFVTDELGCNRIDMVLVRGETADPSYERGVDLDLYRRAAARLQGLEDARAGRSPWGRLLAARPALEREIIASTAAGQPQLQGCTAGSLVAVITERGELMPCELRSERFGNLREVDFDVQALWHSPAAEAFRRELRQDDCHCTFETAVRTSMSFEPRWALRMLRRALRGPAS
jgi:MoaA/NifB/PqqE/SkfB family radical SAM enzyme